MGKTQASKPAENIQELKSTQEERQCEEKKADSPLKWEVYVEGFTAALMQFRISVSHVPDFETDRSIQSGDKRVTQWMSITARKQDIFALSFLFVYLFLGIQIYSWISQIKQFPLYTHLRFRDRWTRSVNQVLLTGRGTTKGREPCANVWFVPVDIQWVPVPFCVAVLAVRT